MSGVVIAVVDIVIVRIFEVVGAMRAIEDHGACVLYDVDVNSVGAR